MEKKDELTVLKHLEALGISRESISDSKWKQLCVIYDTIKKMQQTSAELQVLQKKHTITVSNVERMVNEQPGIHISHALFYQKNKGGLINPFIESFKETTTDQIRPDKENELMTLSEKLNILAKRDYDEDLYKRDLLTLIETLERNGIPIPRLNKKYERPNEKKDEHPFIVFPPQKNKS